MHTTAFYTLNQYMYMYIVTLSLLKKAYKKGTYLCVHIHVIPVFCILEQLPKL